MVLQAKILRCIVDNCLEILHAGHFSRFLELSATLPNLVFSTTTMIWYRVQ
jgi:hypothetical protein